MRKRFEPALKAKIALKAFGGEKTLSQIASEYSVHPNQISQCKQELIHRSAELFNKHGNDAIAQNRVDSHYKGTNFAREIKDRFSEDSFDLKTRKKAPGSYFKNYLFMYDLLCAEKKAIDLITEDT